MSLFCNAKQIVGHFTLSLSLPQTAKRALASRLLCCPVRGYQLSGVAQQHQQEQARKLLADIYGWFTEGFDTGDLQEARVLLEELA